MTKSRLFVVAVLPVFVVGCQSASTPIAASTPAHTAAPTPEFWSEKGLVLTAGDFGHPDINGQLSFADSEIARLPDGRVRIYMYIGSPNGSGPGYGVGSMVSADGLHWTLEPGNRCSRTCGQIAVARAPSGEWKIFGNGGGGITSATSSDGLSWKDDPGFRITIASFPHSAGEVLGGAHITAVASGGWRMYFHLVNPTLRPGSAGPPVQIVSAFSPDLLNWTPDPGIRATAGLHPDVIALPTGGYQMFANPGFDIDTAFSADGLTWPATFSKTYLQGGDPDPLLLPDGRIRLYYNDADFLAKQGGGLFWAEQEPANWNVNFPSSTQIAVTGSGGPVTVRATDRGRSQTRAVDGLPYTARPPYQASYASLQPTTYQPLIEVSDGSMNRYFDAYNLPGSGSPGPFGPEAITCAGPGFITPCPSPNSCGAGTSTPCPIPCGAGPDQLPCGIIRNAPPCQTGQPVGSKGCIATDANGMLRYCPSRGAVNPDSVSGACKPFYQNGS